MAGLGRPRRDTVIEPQFTKTVYEGDPARVLYAQELLEQLKVKRERAARREALNYFNNPALWARDNILWKESDHLTSYQVEILEQLPVRRRVCVRSPHGSGKDLSVETRLPTPTGWTTMGEVQAGDWLLNEEGHPCEVVYAEEPQWREAYRVASASGSPIIAGAGHLWTVLDVDERPARWESTQTLETWQLLDSPTRWCIPALRRSEYHCLAAVEPVGKQLTKCIAVDSSRRLFLAGDDMVPTHNTSLAAIATLWFATTREQMGVDWKIITTASNWNQLTHYLWPEIHKWIRVLNWEKLALAKWTKNNVLGMTLKGDYGSAFGMSPADPSGIEGAHATELLYIFDESKVVPTAIFDAAEGAFSTAGVDAGTNAYAFSISTPGEPSGRFWDIQNRAPGTEDWWVRHITLQEAMEAGRVTEEWVEQRRLLWGQASAVFQNRVMGEFAADAADSVVPLAWIEMANDRWRKKYELPDGKVKGTYRTPHVGTPAVLSPGEKIHIIGVDVAAAGEDKSVIALRQGNTICELRRFPYTDDLMELANIVTGIQRNHKTPKAIVDANGIGAGVADRLRELRQPCQSFISQAGIHRRDASGDFSMRDCRAWAYWNLREMLTPHSGCEVALPPDDRLTGDLTSLKWTVAPGARIVIEEKKEIRKRIGRSTDDGDACLVPGTLVLTARGQVPIEEVTTEDQVLTRYGWKRVLWAGQTQATISVQGIELANGGILVGTSNHPVWGGEGFDRLDVFAPGDECLVRTTLWRSRVFRVVRCFDGGRSPVYNLTVDDQPEFFANGILVHNCAQAFFTYGSSWASVYTGPSAEAKEVTPEGTPTGARRRAGSFADLFKSPEQLEEEHQARMAAEAEAQARKDEELPAPREQRGWYGGRRGSWFSSTD